MSTNNEDKCFKCLGAQGIRVKNFQKRVRPPLAVSSIVSYGAHNLVKLYRNINNKVSNSKLTFHNSNSIQFSKLSSFRAALYFIKFAGVLEHPVCNYLVWSYFDVSIFRYFGKLVVKYVRIFEMIL